MYQAGNREREPFLYGDRSAMIYLDHAATTPLCQESYEAMLPFFREEYANPSGAYRFARRAREVVEDTRAQIADLLGAAPGEIFFTSGGSEGDNWALRMGLPEGGHLVTDLLEHHAVTNTALQLQKERHVDITWVKPDGYGVISPDAIMEAVGPGTDMVSVMYANNEIGTIEPIAAIGERLRGYQNVLFHTDAVQAVGHVPLDVRRLNVDLLSASAHKFGGPKGSGFLYISMRCPNRPFLYGGGQEMGRRAGTENVPGIVGMGAALAAAQKKMACSARHQRQLRDYLFRRLINEIPDVIINGSLRNRLPGNVNIGFSGVEGAGLLVLLDAEHICASAGSACNAGSTEASHVLKAIGRSDEQARSSLRFTLGDGTTRDQIDRTVQVLKEAVSSLRQKRK